VKQGKTDGKERARRIVKAQGPEGKGNDRAQNQGTRLKIEVMSLSQHAVKERKKE
jgi:hypothetical protein